MYTIRNHKGQSMESTVGPEYWDELPPGWSIEKTKEEENPPIRPDGSVQPPGA